MRLPTRDCLQHSLLCGSSLESVQGEWYRRNTMQNTYHCSAGPFSQRSHVYCNALVPLSKAVFPSHTVRFWPCFSTHAVTFSTAIWTARFQRRTIITFYFFFEWTLFKKRNKKHAILVRFVYVCVFKLKNAALIKTHWFIETHCIAWKRIPWKHGVRFS